VELRRPAAASFKVFLDRLDGEAVLKVTVVGVEVCRCDCLAGYRVRCVVGARDACRTLAGILPSPVTSHSSRPRIMPRRGSSTVSLSTASLKTPSASLTSKHHHREPSHRYHKGGGPHDHHELSSLSDPWSGLPTKVRFGRGRTDPATTPA